MISIRLNSDKFIFNLEVWHVALKNTYLCMLNPLLCPLCEMNFNARPWNKEFILAQIDCCQCVRVKQIFEELFFYAYLMIAAEVRAICDS